MNYSKKDVIIGFVIIILIVVGAFFYKNNKTSKIKTIPSPVSIEYKNDFEGQFKYDIPENSNSIELKGEGRGLATDKEILADIDNPQVGYFYQGWVEDGGSLVSLGKLVEGKGGWMVEFPQILNTEGKRIIVTLEKDFDNKIEKRILEGSFN